MCARYTITIIDQNFMAIYFQLNTVPEIVPRYNIAPSQKVPVVGLKSDGITRGWHELTWGFVPHWANNPTDGPRPVNARAETVATSPPFRESFKSRRCLIPADGFYEWLTEGKVKIPHRFTPTTGKLMAFAGIWDVWKSPGSPSLHTCAILTVPANDALKPFHDRMPAILHSDQFSTWLNPHTKPDAARQLLQSAPADALHITRVKRVVNKASNNTPECIEPEANEP